MADGSETVNLDGSPRDAFFNQKSRDLCTLISLKLDDLTSLFVVNKSTVACEFLELIWRVSKAVQVNHS